MTADEADMAALITPVDDGVQREAVELLKAGHRNKALRRLRRHSGLGLVPAVRAAELLAQGRRLPSTYAEGLVNLRSAAADVVAEMTTMLQQGQSTAAIKRLRKLTDIDLAGGYHLVRELARELGIPQD